MYAQTHIADKKVTLEIGAHQPKTAMCAWLKDTVATYCIVF